MADELANRIAKAMQDTRDQIGATEQQRIAFAYAEAAMRSVVEQHTRIEPEAADRGVSEAWQPIETAPTGNEADGPFFDVAWAGHSHRYLPVPAREVDCYRTGNTIKRRHGYPSVTTIFRPQPTHWRPLPEKPAIQSLRSEQEGSDQPEPPPTPNPIVHHGALRAPEQ